MPNCRPARDQRLRTEQQHSHRNATWTGLSSYAYRKFWALLSALRQELQADADEFFVTQAAYPAAAARVWAFISKATTLSDIRADADELEDRKN